MARNKITDLNNHLFAQLERLSDEDVKGDALQSEIERSKALSGVARDIIATGKLALDAQKYCKEWGEKGPEMLGLSDK